MNLNPCYHSAVFQMRTTSKTCHTSFLTLFLMNILFKNVDVWAVISLFALR